MMSNKTISLIALAILAFGASALDAQTTKRNLSAQDSIKRVSDKMQGKQTYKLAYKLKKGDVLKFSTNQNVATRVQGGGYTTESASRSTTEKSWKVVNVDRLGNITFSLTHDAVDMWTKTQDLPVDPENPVEPVTYNSKTDKEVPEMYKQTSQSIGKTLSIFSIAPNGKILNRQSNMPENSFSAGKVTIPLPEHPIQIGFVWNVPTVLEATDDNGENIQLKARIRYELARVEGRVAYIRFKTEILTPVTSEKVKSTIMQKITKGEVAFDIEKGHPVLKQVRWNEKAQGFAGPDSLLEFVGRMTEKVIAKPATTSTKTSNLLSPIAGNIAAKRVEIKTRDGKPITRR